MTIQDFIDECAQVVKGLNIVPSISADYIRGSMVDAIIEHFKNKGIEVKEYTYTATEFGFETKEKVKLSTGEEAELNIKLKFGTVIKKTDNIIMVTPTKGKYENVVGDNPVKFKEADVDYHIPAYEMDNGKVTPNKRGMYSFEPVKFLQKVKKTDTAKDIAGKVDIESIEDEFNSHLCQPVLNEILIFKKDIPGAVQFINYDTKNIDIKGLADFIRKNMM